MKGARTLWLVQIEQCKQEILTLALAEANGNVASAARKLGIPRPYFHHLMKKLRVMRPVR